MQLFTSYHLLNDYFTDNPTHRSTRSARAGTDGDRNARVPKKSFYLIVVISSKIIKNG